VMSCRPFGYFVVVEGFAREFCHVHYRAFPIFFNRRFFFLQPEQAYYPPLDNLERLC
jgi:hypothetical protein